VRAGSTTLPNTGSTPLLGSSNSCVKKQNSSYSFIQLLNLLVVMSQELELEKFITHEVPFSEINKAFDYMLSGAGLRCIIRMEA